MDGWMEGRDLQACTSLTCSFRSSGMSLVYSWPLGCVDHSSPWAVLTQCKGHWSVYSNVGLRCVHGWYNPHSFPLSHNHGPSETQTLCSVTSAAETRKVGIIGWRMAARRKTVRGNFPLLPLPCLIKSTMRCRLATGVSSDSPLVGLHGQEHTSPCPPALCCWLGAGLGECGRLVSQKWRSGDNCSVCCCLIQLHEIVKKEKTKATKYDQPVPWRGCGAAAIDPPKKVRPCVACGAWGLCVAHSEPLWSLLRLGSAQAVGVSLGTCAWQCRQRAQLHLLLLPAHACEWLRDHASSTGFEDFACSLANL